MYEILYHESVVAIDIPKLGAAERKRIKKAIEEKLRTYPELSGTPLHQSLVGYRKLRVGDYRIVFRITKRSVHVFVIGHRSVVYGVAARRA